MFSLIKKKDLKIKKFRNNFKQKQKLKLENENSSLQENNKKNLMYHFYRKLKKCKLLNKTSIFQILISMT